MSPQESTQLAVLAEKWAIATNNKAMAYVRNQGTDHHKNMVIEEANAERAFSDYRRSLTYTEPHLVVA